MREFTLIYVLLALAIFCFFSAFIIQLRSKKARIGTPEQDFIDWAIETKRRDLAQIPGSFSVHTYLLMASIAPLFLVLLMYLFTSDITMSLIGGLAGVVVPEVLVRLLADKHRKQFDERYAQALRSMASSLRSSMTIQQAVEDVGKSVFIHESIRKGFRQIASDLKVGISVENAFRRYAEECGSKDAHDVAAAIAMQNEVGGNEAFVISSISQNINDRIMVRKEINSLFADTSMMILVMDAAPVVMIGGLYFAAPQYITPYFESFPMTMLFAGLLVVTTLGSVVIRKMARSAKGGS